MPDPEPRPYARFADWSRRHLPPVVPVGRPPLAGLAPEPDTEPAGTEPSPPPASTRAAT